MNLMRIRAHAMLGVSRIWMGDDALCGELAGHPLGSAAAGELEAVHGRLATALHERYEMAQHITELTEHIATAAGRFARKGRALHNAFEVLADFTDDPVQEARYRQLKVLFFPIGLRIFQRTHLEGTGAVEVVRNQVTPALMDELSGITLAGCTLADLYREWVDAAHELGRYLQQRTRTREALRRSGTKAASVDTKAARAEWVRFVRTLLAIADIVRLSDGGRERLLGPLKRAVVQAEGPSTNGSNEADELSQADETLDDPASPLSDPDAQDDKGIEKEAVNENVGDIRVSDKRNSAQRRYAVPSIAASTRADRAGPITSR